MTTVAKTTKSGSEAIAALLANMKKLQPSVQMVTNQEGFVLVQYMFSYLMVYISAL